MIRRVLFVKSNLTKSEEGDEQMTAWQPVKNVWMTRGCVLRINVNHGGRDSHQSLMLIINDTLNQNTKTFRYHFKRFYGFFFPVTILCPLTIRTRTEVLKLTIVSERTTRPNSSRRLLLIFITVEAGTAS